MSLRHGDLEGLVIPLVGIDKFQPKAGTEDEIIVVNIHVKDEAPAKDLERFLEMGTVETLDTETSPSPDEDGHWMVFVEFKRNKQFWSSLRLLLRDIENVTGELRWLVDPLKYDGLCKLNDPQLPSLIITDQEEYKAKMMQDEEQELEVPLDPEFADVTESIKKNHRLTFEAYTGPSDKMIKEYGLDNQVVSSGTSYEQRILDKYVGRTTRIQNNYIIENTDTITVFRRMDD